MIHKNKKFCSVCYNHGKSEKIYTSHFIRENSYITCPTILNNVCLKCFKQGHFTSKCNSNKIDMPFPR